MARSNYIWAVQDGTGAVVAAFSVKHELQSWLDQQDRLLLVTRVRDGSRADSQPTQLNPRTLEPAL